MLLAFIEKYMSKKTLSLIFVIIFLIKISIASAINYEPNQDNKKSLDENVPKMPKVIKNIFSNFEIAIKGQNLNEFFQNQILNLKFKNENKEYRFKEEKYEVFINQKLNETGKWKIKGLLKSFVELSPDNNEPSYFFKKIMDKNIVYYFDKNPDNPNSKKTLVEITPLDKKLEVKKEPKREIKTEPKVIEVAKEPTTGTKTEPKVIEVKKEPKREIKTEPKVIEVAKEPKKEKLEQTSLISASSKKTPPDKKKIIKYICDPGKSEYYWGWTKDNMKLSRYEDSPYAKNQIAKGSNETYEDVVSIYEIDFENNHIFMSGISKYDTNSNGKLESMPYAQRWKIKSHNKKENIFTMISDYGPDTSVLISEVKYDNNSLIQSGENTHLVEMKEGPKYWEKYTDQCIQSEYFVDKNSGDKLIQTFQEYLPLQAKAEKQLFGENESVAVAQSSEKLMAEINRDVLNKIKLDQNKYNNLSKNINKTKDLKNESKKITNEVSKDQLKTYKATSVITYLYFESQANYLASLELLYRAYDKNVEADKIKSQISYIKDSRNSESKRLKSTVQIVDEASKNLKKEINNDSKKLSEDSKILYQKSLPLIFKATEYGYKVFVVSTEVGKNIANSNNKVAAFLSNFNEVIGFASILPTIPDYVKTVGSNARLIFTGAKTKKIKDNENLEEALKQLDLSA